MIRVEARNLGKEFDYRWIFRGIDLDLQRGDVLGIAGPNGAGKSTFLQILSGYLSPSEGYCKLYDKDGAVAADSYYSKICIAAPYIELPEELTLDELIRFHTSFKNPRVASDRWIGISELGAASQRRIKYYSSGMKQRVKLLLAILSDCPVLLLDEPGSNLDKSAAAWYTNLLTDHMQDRIVCIASNDESDFIHANKEVRLGLN